MGIVWTYFEVLENKIQFLYPNSALFSFSDILFSNLNILAMLDYMLDFGYVQNRHLSLLAHPFLTSFASLH